MMSVGTPPPATPPASTLRTRVITAFFFVVVMVAGIYLHPISLLLLLGAANVLCLMEFQLMIRNITQNTSRYVAFERVYMAVSGSILYLLIAFVMMEYCDTMYLIYLLPLAFSFFIKELYSLSRSPFNKVSANVSSLLWITVPFAMAIGIAHINGYFDPNILMGVFLLVWVNDSGAYLVGSRVGKHKFFERISPKKTWEGVAGGFVSAILCGFILSMIWTQLSRTEWLLCAMLSAVFGTIGDLVESLLKRSVQIKDTGSFLPGHGGFLDRFDAFIFAVPFVYTFLYVWRNF
ncbi:MAG: phosphatidate cytidylyltransferase [Sphingobacteriales bacterium]|nr:phosphatidate cytidylyltransferase [Sphingobacteriales bacterium]